MIRKKKSS